MNPSIRYLWMSFFRAAWAIYNVALFVFVVWMTIALVLACLLYVGEHIVDPDEARTFWDVFKFAVCVPPATIFVIGLVSGENG
jgi:hypothetical protein